VNKILRLLIILLLGACAQNTKKDESETPKLYVFDCGHITVSDISIFSPRHDKGKTKKLVDSCYLIRHPKGDFLWDTGLPDKLAAMEKGFQNGPFHLQVKSTLMGQLADLGLQPKDIEMVGISHYHFDHTGNLNNFTSSKILIQKEEYDAAYSKNPAKFGFKPESYAKIDKKNYQVVDGDHDVFGDGSVVILKTVGHTPGHQSLLIRLKGEKPIILTGDFTISKRTENIVEFHHLILTSSNRKRPSLKWMMS
jgi:N-acyl homoserine lactone hydrolase